MTIHLPAAEISRILDSGQMVAIRHMLNGLDSVDIARLISSSPPATQLLLWDWLTANQRAATLPLIDEDLSPRLLGLMDVDEVADIAVQLEPDDLADILQQMPDAVIKEVLRSMDAQHRERIERVLDYPKDCAGGMMNTDVITVRARLTLEVLLRYLRRLGDMPQDTDQLIVVNRAGKFLGLLHISHILVNSPEMTVREVMDTDQAPIGVDMPDTEVAQRFAEHDWVSAPVVDDHGILLGRITVDDVIDVIREEAERPLRSMASMGDDIPSMFTPLFKAVPRRALWLGVNLVTVFFAVSLIKLFEGVLDRVVALAVLMPIAASMGGVAGNQALAVVIRGVAQGNLQYGSTGWLVMREGSIGLINGMFWALVVGVVTWFWYQDLDLAGIIAAAMLVSLVVANLSGAVLPLALHAIKIDPALAGGVLLTTITDVVGFISFLGLAHWLLVA